MPLFYYESEIGRLTIREKEGKITNVYFPYEKLTRDEPVADTPLLSEAAAQLDAYFAGRLREFSLPLGPEGTEFMKQVWSALCGIPYGKTATYGEIAGKVGRPKAARAVGLANNRNPIPIIIPCHRVIGANGSLTGYAGGLDLKRRLLDLEKTT